MIGKADPDYWALFARLPREIQELAREKHKLWRQDPFHPALHFKELTPGIWSARINRQYRAVGRRKADLVIWFWVGSHAEYDRLIQGL